MTPVEQLIEKIESDARKEYPQQFDGVRRQKYIVERLKTLAREYYSAFYGLVVRGEVS
jgi:hypothetical protein